jgi:hypothetical protein
MSADTETPPAAPTTPEDKPSALSETNASDTMQPDADAELKAVRQCACTSLSSRIIHFNMNASGILLCGLKFAV